MAEVKQATAPMEFEGDVSAWLPRLRLLLEEQRGLCARLDALSQKQSSSVADGSTDALLRILGERQVIVERVAVVNALLEPFRARKHEFIARIPEKDRDLVNNQIAQITALVESIQARDENDRKLLERQRAGVSEELGNVSRGRGAMAAYGRLGSGVRPLYQDRQG